MIPVPPKPRFEPGSRIRVVQLVRVGGLSWLTQVTGIVEREGLRPVGGMEMGGKSVYCHQPIIRLRKDDGEITVVALDDDTTAEVVPAA
jgi:hypothetical protein